MIIQLLNSLAGFAAVAFVGWFSAKKGFINDTVCDGLTYIVVKIAVPSAILMSANTEMENDGTFGLLMAVLFLFVFCLAHIIFGSLTGKLLPIDKQHKKAFTLSITFSNVAFLGFPIAYLLFGAEGIFYAALFNLVTTMFMFTYGISTFAGTEGVSLKLRLLGMITQPATLATFAMVALFLGQITFPVFVANTLGLLGGMTTPLSMVVMGVLIAKVNIFSAFTNWLSYVIAFVGLIVSPIIVLFILRFLDFDPVMAATFTILAAMPPAVMLSVLASKYKMLPEFITKTTVLSMLLYIATIPIIIFVIERVYPGVFSL